MSILELPEELFFIESIEMEGCVFRGKENTIPTISKQIWEGSHSIFSFIFRNKQCVGVKDILDEWMNLGTKSILFYIPTATLQEIRYHVGNNKGTQFIANEIEKYLLSKIHKNLPNTSVFSLNDERDHAKLANIFEIESLKKELERTNTSNTHQLYLIGLPFNPYGSDVDFYLNDLPIAYHGGMLLGHSKIFTQRLEKGTMLVSSDDGIRINFFDTHNYISNNENINYDLKSLDFEADSIHFEVSKRKATILESKNSAKLVFSRLPHAQQEALKETEEQTVYTQPTVPTEEPAKTGKIGVELESFYVPFHKNLQKLHLLLIQKEGKNILVGGVYHDALTVNTLAQITVELATGSITITNHAVENLVFEKYTNNLWRLMHQKSKHERQQHDIMYTNISNTSSIKTSLPTQVQKNSNNLTIKPNQTAQLNTAELEFNDANLYVDQTGILIRYSQFELRRFDDTIELNRNLYKVSPKGSLLDAFVQYDATKKSFLNGAKEQEGFSDVLSRAISSKPVTLTYYDEYLTIENQLDEEHYIVQVLSPSQKYLLEEEHKRIQIKPSDLQHLKIDIMNKAYRNRPLIRFTLTYKGEE